MTCRSNHANCRSFTVGAAPLFFAAALLLTTACVSPKYKFADKGATPPRPLNVGFSSSVLETSLFTVISDGSPGSWKREAFWDEYVITVHNEGEQALTIAACTVTDPAGTVRTAGTDPWELERESRKLEKRYRDAGIAFARMAAPRVIVSAAEPGVVASAGLGATGAAAAATATAVALPMYGATVFGINMHNKAAIRKEFDRRRLSLPLTLGPGQTRTGSFFFPMVPNPQRLTLRWASSAGEGETTLELEFLRGLHVSEDVR